MNEKYSVQVDEDMKTVLETLEDTSRQYLDKSSQMLATLALNFYARNQNPPLIELAKESCEAVFTVIAARGAKRAGEKTQSLSTKSTPVNGETQRKIHKLQK
ncbi:hypothetical protein VNI00_004508 [Paramarasmius palmivorus]|uniref:Uncharacterized protein n=1 Tax=Paramarasmius palmivorus TaxID=297713 RepID=A0AAW0DJ92_9AGAR